jgi:DNA-directed RNA polymerase specialized sigma24 family protein
VRLRDHILARPFTIASPAPYWGRPCLPPGPDSYWEYADALEMAWTWIDSIQRRVVVLNWGFGPLQPFEEWVRDYLGLPVTTLTEDPGEVFTETRLESAAPAKARQILAALPERYRRILQLRFLEACTVAEAARAMGISVANAKVLQHRALRRAAEVAAGLE